MEDGQTALDLLMYCKDEYLFDLSISNIQNDSKEEIYNLGIILDKSYVGNKEKIQPNNSILNEVQKQYLIGLQKHFESIKFQKTPSISLPDYEILLLEKWSEDIYNLKRLNKSEKKGKIYDELHTWVKENLFKRTRKRDSFETKEYEYLQDIFTSEGDKKNVLNKIIHEYPSEKAEIYSYILFALADLELINIDFKKFNKYQLLSDLINKAWASNIVSRQSIEYNLKENVSASLKREAQIAKYTQEIKLLLNIS